MRKYINRPLKLMLVSGCAAALVLGSSASLAWASNGNSLNSLLDKIQGNGTETVSTSTPNNATRSGLTDLLKSGTAPAPKDAQARYTAYLNVCQSIIDTYGTPSKTSSVGQYEPSYGNGLCFATLLDMDADGGEELIIAYGNPYTTPIVLEVWGYRDGAAVLEFESNVSTHATNGYLPLLDIYKRTDIDGWAILTTNCYGSSPVLFEHILSGYNNGRMVTIQARWSSEYAGPSSYHIGKFPLGGYSPDTAGDLYPDEGKAVFDAAFEPWLGKVETPALGILLYDAPDMSIYNNPESYLSLNETIVMTEDTLAKLTAGSKGNQTAK